MLRRSRPAVTDPLRPRRRRSRAGRRRVAVLVAVLLAPAIFSSSAAADAISISLGKSTVAAGGTLIVHVTPGAPLDGYTFHEARVFLMRPGMPCPSGGSDPAFDDLLASGGAGPFRQGDPPEDVGLTVDDDAPLGFATLCTQVWLLATGLAGEPLPGPSASVHVVGATRGRGRGGEQRRGGSLPRCRHGRDRSGHGRARCRRRRGGFELPGHSRGVCRLGPHHLRHGSARLRVRCRGLRRARLRLRLRCVRRDGDVRLRRRAVRLRTGRGSVRVRGLRRGRCGATLRRDGAVVGRATIVVR